MTTDEKAPPQKKRNERTCAGCQKHADAHELVRVVLDPTSGELAVDLAHSGFGRGAHVHGAPDCLAKALKKGGFARVFKQEITGDAEAIGQSIVQAADRRIEGLLSGAKRAGHLAVGGDAVTEAVKEPGGPRSSGTSGSAGIGAEPRAGASLIVVARDAAAAAKLPVVERAIAAGDAIAFTEKTRLGALVGGNREVAVVAILHAGVAAAVRETYRLSGAFRKDGDAWSSSEVR